jgi:hypothetical protein
MDILKKRWFGLMLMIYEKMICPAFELHSIYRDGKLAKIEKNQAVI